MSYTTSEIASLCGIHPNTVRIYEEWGYLSPVPRLSNNYRQFSYRHLLELQYVLLILKWPYPGGKRQALEAVNALSRHEDAEAFLFTTKYLDQIRTEIGFCEEVCIILDEWAIKQDYTLSTGDLWTSKEVAQKFSISKGALRNWVRNGLIHPERSQRSQPLFREYDLTRIRIIRLLRSAGYSLMAILRMLLRLEKGDPCLPSQNLESPGEEEDILTVADQWMTNLKQTEQRVLSAIHFIQENILT